MRLFSRFVLAASAALLLATGAASAEKLRIGTEGAYPPFNYLDRKGLPAPDVSIQRKTECIAPRNELERKIAATMASVLVPGMEGQAGLAALECDGAFDPESFWRTVQGLPAYAQPRFVRVIGRLSTTGTFKIQKTELRAEGVDPEKVQDPLYVRLDDGYSRLTPELWKDVVDGRVRL